MNRISVLLAVISVVINFANYIFFYNDINPFYEFFSFLAFVAGALGITLPVVGIAAIIAVFFIISKKHKHGYLYYFAILFLILSLFSVVISVSNAAYEKDALSPPEPASPPSSVEPAPLVELVIPAHFTTYTDEVGLFSISYPSDWELALSKIEGLTQDVEDYLKDIKSEGSLAGGKVVFFAGVPCETGHNPNVSVVVTPSGEGKWKLEDLVEAVVQRGLMKDAEEYNEFSQTKIVVEGREAIILDSQAKYPLIGELRALTMYLRGNKLVWAITCGVMPPQEFSDFESDLHAIVRSLRILK